MVRVSDERPDTRDFPKILLAFLALVVLQVVDRPKRLRPNQGGTRVPSGDSYTD
jgi:hypothetical protein